MIKNSFRNALGAASLLLLGVSAHAQSGSAMDDYGGNEARFGWYVDFAATTTAGHYAEPTFTFPGTAAPVKYHFLQLNSFTSNAAACFDISTNHPDGLPGVTADTRIWYWNGTANTYMVLNDDIQPGSNYFSHGMVYLSGSNAFMNLYIASYNSTQSDNYNTAQFKVYAMRRNLTEAQCTTGNGGVPWVMFKNGVVSHY
jgi:hypothetical protein